ncbi:Scr1 family TA system antitoxin-like transcriptional regulator [Streptomyces sp. NPDC051567]|uniref:Scr1 family TA system antitoxin-like transcriptional regulator n=1 Tax=Streptomyces sp. NPDC051567 TaxID=3365660 RepID=UPI003793192C
MEAPEPGRTDQSPAGVRASGRRHPPVPRLLLERGPRPPATPAYAAAVISAYGTFHGTTDDVEAAAAARVKRSRVLRKRGRQFAFLIEEAVLHSGLAGPETTAAQLDHLLELTTLPQVSLGIIATRASRPLWSMESFTIYDNTQVGIELLSARVTVTAPGEITTYERAFADLTTKAVRGDGARALIERAAAAHR